LDGELQLTGNTCDDPLYDLAKNHREEMQVALEELLDDIDSAESETEVSELIEDVLDAHPPATFFRRWDKYVAPLRTFLSRPALDRIVNDPEQRAALALRDDKSIAEGIEEPEWLDSAETFSALHSDIATWHAIHDGTDAEVQRFLAERNAASEAEQLRQNRRNRPRHQPLYGAQRPAPPPVQLHAEDAELGVVSVPLSQPEASQPRGVKRTFPTQSDEDARASKRSRYSPF
jgi:hypothetical protein